MSHIFRIMDTLTGPYRWCLHRIRHYVTPQKRHVRAYETECRSAAIAFDKARALVYSAERKNQSIPHCYKTAAQYLEDCYYLGMHATNLFQENDHIYLKA